MTETGRAKREAGVSDVTRKRRREREWQEAGDRESGEVRRIGGRRAPERQPGKAKVTGSETDKRAYDEAQTMHAPPAGCRLRLEPNGERKQDQRL